MNASFRPPSPKTCEETPSAFRSPASDKPRVGRFRSCLLYLLFGAFGFFGILATAYYVFQRSDASNFDPLVRAAYQSWIRPRLERELAQSAMPEDQRHERLERFDSVLRHYLDLSPPQKKQLLQEALLAGYYLSRNKIMPLEKSVHLRAFIQEQALMTDVP